MGTNLRMRMTLAVCGGLFAFQGEVTAQSVPDPIVVSAPQQANTVDVPASGCKGSLSDWWKQIPPVAIIPRPGYFGNPPKGDGYYSLIDCIEGNCREVAPKNGYVPYALMAQPFYNADFHYLDAPNYVSDDPLDRLHRIHLGDHWLFSTGGEVRYRYMNEVNSRLSGKDNTYDLVRGRIYGDLWYQDRFRVYVEFLDAQSFNQDLPPLAIDRDFGDLLDAFVDVKILDIGDKPAYLRVGRQELLLGSQRLVSPLDWANTRRTFEGASAFRQGEKFDVEAFWVQPVIPDASKFDTRDNNQNFAGLWTTYRPQKGTALDLYYLFLDNTNKKTAKAIDMAPYSVHTVGSRYVGDKDGWLWDVEGMFQFGDRGHENIVAGSGTAGAGYHFADLPWNPTFWAYYDYASGDRSINKGDYNTFNQLFPYGHYYFGWLDLVGRENIRDVSGHAYLYPANWITLNAQYHHFELDSATDALYSAGGVALRRSPTGAAGKDVGNELDLIANFHLTNHSDILTSYSKLYAGDYLRATGSGRSPELFTVMYNYRW